MTICLIKCNSGIESYTDSVMAMTICYNNRLLFTGFGWHLKFEDVKNSMGMIESVKNVYRYDIFHSVRAVNVFHKLHQHSTAYI